MCGFFGILGSPETMVSPEIYDGLLMLQHRGQDAAGMVTFDGRFHLKKGTGLVSDIFQKRNMQRLQGAMGIGHVRYPTFGGGTAEDAQPFQVHYPYGIAMAHNGNITNFNELENYLTHEKKALLNSTCDVEVILNMFAVELGRMGVPDPSPDVIESAVRGVFERVKGAYSVVAIIAHYGLIAFRDPMGIRPMVYGRRRAADGSWEYAAASENVALDILGFEVLRDVEPGELIIFRQGEEPVHRQVVRRGRMPCVFEHVYFARPDSVIDTVSVYELRRRFGERLAHRWRETGLSADVVIPVPDSACTAAGTLARTLGLEYREGLVKNRYIGRTFIMAGDGERRSSIRRKLNAIPSEFAGKDVLLVDDSIVRGNTSRQIVELARQAGARKVYFASCAPPVQHVCVYGIDMSTRQELLARDRSIEEIREYLGADHVIYQTVEDLREVARPGSEAVEGFCMACFDGDYVTGDVTSAMFSHIEESRAHQHSIESATS
ncbi:MAG: amidophosphoribosyltransferase [Planctomycetota bacterium]|jgi:amidophosphoribosyltransferase